MAEEASADTTNRQLEQLIFQRLAADYFTQQDFELEPVSQQSTHQCFKLKTVEQDYFLKWFSGLPSMANLGEQQIAIQQQVAAQSASVPVTFAPPDSRYLLMPYVASLNLAQSKNYSQREKINLLAQQLLKLHQLKIESSAIALGDILTDYLQQIGDFPQPLHHQVSEVIELTDHWWSVQLEQSTCFCHHDLSMTNLLLHDQPVAIDWEYAAVGAPLYDLACCINVNQLSEREQNWLLEDYLILQGRLLEFQSQQQLLVPFRWVSLLCNRLWELAQIERPVSLAEQQELESLIPRITNLIK